MTPGLTLGRQNLKLLLWHDSFYGLAKSVAKFGYTKEQRELYFSRWQRAIFDILQVCSAFCRTVERSGRGALELEQGKRCNGIFWSAPIPALRLVQYFLGQEEPRHADRRASCINEPRLISVAYLHNPSEDRIGNLILAAAAGKYDRINWLLCESISYNFNRPASIHTEIYCCLRL